MMDIIHGNIDKVPKSMYDNEAIKNILTADSFG